MSSALATASSPWTGGDKPVKQAEEERFCRCGKRLSSYNRSRLCYACQAGQGREEKSPYSPRPRGVTRRRILEALQSGEATAPEMAKELEISNAAVNGHIRQLKADGHIRVCGERFEPRGRNHVNVWELTEKGDTSERD